MKTLGCSVLLALSCFAADLTVGPVSASTMTWDEQRDYLQTHSFLWIKDFFTQEQVEQLRNWADGMNTNAQELLSMSQSTGRPLQELFQEIPQALIVVPEAKNPMQVCRTEDMLTCFPDLLAFMQKNVTDYLSEVAGEPYVLFKDKLNFKWPGGGAFTPHQDFPAYEFFGPREHITAMICIDPATEENGCLKIAANWPSLIANNQELQTADSPAESTVLPFIIGGPSHGSIEPVYLDRAEWLSLTVSPGDIVFFTSYIPHYSEPNRSASARRAMFITHNRQSEGEHRQDYYFAKRTDPDNPVFHIGTPTKARSK